MYRLEIMPKAEADFARLDATVEQRKLGQIQPSYTDAIIKRYSCGTVTEKSPEMW